jgi:hypothetical protein
LWVLEKNSKRVFDVQLSWAISIGIFPQLFRILICIIGWFKRVSYHRDTFTTETIAKCNGVFPSWFTTFSWIIWYCRKGTTEEDTFFVTAILWWFILVVVVVVVVVSFLFWGCCTNVCRNVRLPLKHATCNGIQPLLFGWFKASGYIRINFKIGFFLFCRELMMTSVFSLWLYRNTKVEWSIILDIPFLKRNRITSSKTL